MRSRPAGRRRLTVGIAGCGKIADAHVEQARAVGAEVVAVCDTEPLMAGRLGTRLEIEARYDGLVPMLAAHRLDVVHVTTPPTAHASLVATAMAAGCHVFVEKPLAPTAAATREVVATAQATDRRLAVNLWHDFEPVTAALDQLLAEGVLGEPVHVDSVLGYDLAGDYGSAAVTDPDHWVHQLPGRLFHNVLDHVVSKMARLVPDGQPAITTADAAADELRFLVNGQTVSGFGMVSAHARPLANTLRVYGTANTARVDYESRTVTLEADRTLPTALGRLPLAFDQARQLRRAGRHNIWQFARGDFHYFAGMRRLLDAFYESVRSGGPPPVAYDHLVRVAEWIDAIVAGQDLRQEDVR